MISGKLFPIIIIYSSWKVKRLKHLNISRPSLFPPMISGCCDLFWDFDLSSATIILNVVGCKIESRAGGIGKK
jgi:hypothetical protein